MQFLGHVHVQAIESPWITSWAAARQRKHQAMPLCQATKEVHDGTNALANRAVFSLTHRTSFNFTWILGGKSPASCTLCTLYSPCPRWRLSSRPDLMPFSNEEMFLVWWQEAHQRWTEYWEVHLRLDSRACLPWLEDAGKDCAGTSQDEGSDSDNVRYHESCYLYLYLYSHHQIFSDIWENHRKPICQDTRRKRLNIRFATDSLITCASTLYRSAGSTASWTRYGQNMDKLLGKDMDNGNLQNAWHDMTLSWRSHDRGYAMLCDRRFIWFKYVQIVTQPPGHHLSCCSFCFCRSCSCPLPFLFLCPTAWSACGCLSWVLNNHTHGKQLSGSSIKFRERNCTLW